MKIGIDIDGVIADIGKFIADYGTKFCYENNIEYKIKADEYSPVSALGVTDNEVYNFFDKYLEYYATEYPPKYFAKEVIDILKENNEICIITARSEKNLPPERFENMSKLVKEWLDNNGIYYDKLIFSKGSKLPYCLENEIDVMIEDSPRNILDISSKIKVLCFDNPYNKNIEGENITRVYSWYDILRKIEEIQN